MKFLSVMALVLSAVVVKGQQTTPSDAGVSLTAPVQQTVWQGGSTQEITWTVTNAAAGSISDITLFKGQSWNLTQLNSITSGSIPISSGSYPWAIDPNTETGVDYVLRVTSPVGETYSSYFTIIGRAPGAPTTSVPSPTASGASNALGSSKPNQTNGKSSNAAVTLSTGMGSAAAVIAAAVVLCA